MSDSEWPERGFHPVQDVLLLYLEGDLATKKAEAVAAHLQKCWQCSAELQNLKQGIWSFMAFREKVLLPSVPVDPRVRHIRRLLASTPADDDEAAGRFQSQGSFFWRISPFTFRPAWIAGLASLAVLLGVLYFSIMLPSPLLARELLTNVQRSLALAQASERDKVVTQKVLVRCGSVVAECEVVRGRPDSPRVVASAPPALARTITGPLSWEDPLNLDSFLAWRANQKSLRESVSEASDVVTLTDTITQKGIEDGPTVRKVLLTVLRANWHIVEKRVEMEGAPDLDARETSYVVSERPAPVTLSKVLRKPPLSRLIKESAPASSAVSTDDLNLAELRIREVLFRNRASTAAAEVTPTLRRTTNRIQIEGVISSPDRREQLKIAMAAIPYAADAIRSSVSPPASTDQPGGIGRVSTSDSGGSNRAPLLRDTLIQKLGNEKKATDFSDRILDEVGENYSLAVQYHDLAQAFPSSKESALPRNVRDAVEGLAQEIERALSDQLRIEASLLTPIFAEEPFQREFPRDTVWQNRASAFFQLATFHERLVSRLFAVTEGDPPVPGDAQSTVAELQACLRKMTALTL